jgi:hypothetical protein
LPPLEGDELILKDRSIWIVKGCYHPPKKYVAMPRVVDGRKVKTFKESLALVRRYYRHYLMDVPEIGYEVPVVPENDVLIYKKVLDWKPSDSGKVIESVAGELIALLNEGCGLTCGISGSILGGYATKTSDIDVVCIDREGAYGCLKKLRTEDLIQPLYPEYSVKELWEVKEVIPPELHAGLASQRLTQGIFKGYPYTLKIVNCGRGNELFREPLLSTLSDLTLLLRGSDYRCPSIYPVSLLSSSTVLREAYLITFRTRFTELKEGTIIRGVGIITYDKSLERAWISFDRPPSTVKYLSLPPNI